MPRKSRSELTREARRIRGQHTMRACTDAECPVHHPYANRDKGK